MHVTSFNDRGFEFFKECLKATWAVYVEESAARHERDIDQIAPVRFTANVNAIFSSSTYQHSGDERAMRSISVGMVEIVVAVVYPI